MPIALREKMNIGRKLSEGSEIFSRILKFFPECDTIRFIETEGEHSGVKIFCCVIARSGLSRNIVESFRALCEARKEESL